MDTTPSFVFNSRPQIGRNAHLFQPPPPQTTTATDYFSPIARKRARADSSVPAPSSSNLSYTPRTTYNKWAQCPTPSEGSYTSAASDSANDYVNDRYILAGGLDTPALKAAAEIHSRMPRMRSAERRRTREDGFDAPSNEHIAPVSGPLARERNGVARIPAFRDGNEEPTSSWTGLAFGLVGKVFNFGTNVIRGFYAGGGTGFDLKGSESSPGMWDAPRHQVSTPLPGAWQEDDYFDGNSTQDDPSAPPSGSRPAVKRRQTDRDSWVMVGATEVDSTPRRKVSGNNANTRGNVAIRPSASRASSRRNLAPVARRQTSHVSYAGSPVQLPSHADGPRRASFAPTRSPRSRPSSAGAANPPKANTYMSPEAERYAKRQAKQDRAADKTMSSMSKTLEDLIRQGQEALGTKISIEDGGFEDEGW
ncbi:Hypothetical protein R9X50_00222800 [Acrodontium crateriforme]|uniref:Uncharacterized protein n=1 Tax=Acrodontium crateriforme TaxID=150365 RepID=A0AAQ3R8T3_9PEZI|nr:Hypothetical protein R9X50_00222800 [Acrodontium crateriforme]